MKIINNITSIVSYINVNINKYYIYKDNKGKSGIYLWTNLINGKRYVGSAKNITRRLSDYFSIDKYKRIRTKGHSMINKAILKHGISNFRLDILEYCEFNLIEKEQCYIDILKPEYNILKIAGSRLGHKLSQEAKFAMSIRNKGCNNPMYNKHHTKETRFIMSLNNKSFNNPMWSKNHSEETKFKIKMSSIKTRRIKGFLNNHMLGKNHSEATKRKISESNKLYKKYNGLSIEDKLNLSLTSVGLLIKVYDNMNNLVHKFSSLRKAARYFNISVPFIRKYINTNKRYKDYIFMSEIKNNKIRIYDSNNKLIEIQDNAMKISRSYNIPRTTLYRYIKTEKLYKNKYYFIKK